MVAIREPEKILVGLLRNNVTDLNGSRSGQWIFPFIPEEFPSSLTKYPIVSCVCVNEDGEQEGLFDTDYWNNFSVQIDVFCRKHHLLTKTVTDEAVGTIANSPRISLDYIPTSITNIKHGGAEFTSVTAVSHDDDFTDPTAGTCQYSLATGNLNFNSTNITTYAGQAITATYDIVLEGSNLARWVARDIIKQIRTVTKTDLSTSNVIYYPKLINNSVAPFDELNQIHRRIIEFRFNAENIGE